MVEYDDGTDYGGSSETYRFEDERYGGGGRRRGGQASYERTTQRWSHSTFSLRATHSCASVLNAPTQIFKTKKQKQVFRSKPTVTEGRGEEPAEEDPDGCGPECRNLLHESDHRKEDAKCPYDGMVIDIYGYCR